MSVLGTSSRTIRLMWPLFVSLAVVTTIAGEFVSLGAMLGVQLIVYSMVLYLIHQTILSGSFNFFARNDSERNTKGPSFRFVALTVALVWLPMLAGVAAAFLVLPDPAAYQGWLIYPFMALGVWISLSVFGIAIPRHVWRDLNEGAAIEHQKPRNQRSYVATRLLLCNLLYFLALLILLLGLDRAADFFIGIPNQYSNLAIGIVVEAFSYVPMVMTAAVLSHAHLRASNLQAQGLVSKL